MTALMTPELATRINKANEYLVKMMKDNERLVITGEIAKLKLAEANIEFKHSKYSELVYVDCDQLEKKSEFLKSVYKVLGKLKDTGEREVIDTRRHIVKVKLHAVDYPGVRVSYLHKLDKNSKCKIKKVRIKATKARTETQVVCNA